MTLTSENLKGMWAGLPVPWNNQDQLDERALRENVRRVCNIGAHGVYTHGTTGEFYAQTFEEWQQVAQATIEECRKLGTPTQVGCTALWTSEVIRKAIFAQEICTDGIQLAFPFWLSLTDSEAVKFLKDVSSAVPEMPIILYNTARSKKPLTPGLLKCILKEDIPIIGCKGVGNEEELRIFQEIAPQMKIFVGEPQLAEWWELGARGSYSALIYTCPRLMLRYFDLCEKGGSKANQIADGLKRIHSSFVKPLAKEGFTDTAFDRVFAAATGFLTGPLLSSRPPYRMPTMEDVDFLRRCSNEVFPELLEKTKDVVAVS